MKNALCRIMAFTVLAFTTISLLAAKPRVGLVLSGGGAKGIAHVGVIQALEENDIAIDCVAGTSMGSIVGSLYACGFTPDEMMDLFTSPEFTAWSTGVTDPSYTYYYDKSNPTPRMLSIGVNFKDSTTVGLPFLNGSLINPIPMNFGFLDLFSGYNAQCHGDFDDLMLPFRCVCSDVYHKHKIICRDGDLANAVRASMTFPMVFKPIEMNGVLVYDGGIYDNFPVDVMHSEFDPEFIIGVSVSGPDAKPKPDNMLQQLEDMIIQNNDYTLPEELGVKIQVPVLQFGVLDFGKAQEIYDIGYHTGLAMVDSIKNRTTARMSSQERAKMRMEWKYKTPPLKFGSITVIGNKLSNRQKQYIESCFKDDNDDTIIDINQVRDSYYRLVSGGKIEDIRPTAKFNSDAGLFNLNLDVTPRKHWSAGFGGWLTTSTNSFLYLDIGYKTLSFNSLDVNLGGWLGQSYFAGALNTRFALRTAQQPSCFDLQVSTGRRKYYDSDVLFTKMSTPSFVTRYNTSVSLSYNMAINRIFKAEAGIGYEYSQDRFYSTEGNDFSDSNQEYAGYNTVGIRMGLSSNTLDNNMYASTGQMISAFLWGYNDHLSYRMGKYGKSSGDGKYRAMLELNWTKYLPVYKNVTVGLFGQLMATFGSLGGNYRAAIVHAPGFGPTPSTRYYFNEAFRAYNYMAVGIMPVFNIFSNMQVRGDFYLYMPIRNMSANEKGNAIYNGWFKKAEFLGEVAAIYNFSFASLSVYANYLTGVVKNWNIGIAFGLMFDAPRFFR